MKALQRLTVAGHWAAFTWLVWIIGVIFYVFVIENERWTDDGWTMLLASCLPTAAFAFGGWVFTGKFILWPWKQSLPKQED